MHTVSLAAAAAAAGGSVRYPMEVSMEKEFRKLNLTPFLSISTYNKSYKFIDEKDENLTSLRLFPLMYKLSLHSFEKYILWFEKFESYVKQAGYSKTTVCILLAAAIYKKGKIVDLIEIASDDTINTILQLKINIARILFHIDKFDPMIYLYKLAKSAYSQSMQYIWTTFKRACLIHVSRCLCFNKINTYGEQFLGNILKIILPVKYDSCWGDSLQRITNLEDLVWTLRVLHFSEKKKTFKEKLEQASNSFNNYNDRDIDKSSVNRICSYYEKSRHMKEHCEVRKEICNCCKDHGNNINVYRNQLFRDKEEDYQNKKKQVQDMYYEKYDNFEWYEDEEKSPNLLWNGKFNKLVKIFSPIELEN